MKKETPIKLWLYVVYGEKIIGPIKLTVYPTHTPSLMLQKDMDDILGLPMGTQNPKRLYHLRKHTFLDDKMSYKQQKVKTDDCVVLTDHTDIDLIHVVANTISQPITESPQESRIKIVILGFLKGIHWIGPGIDAIFLERIEIMQR